MAQTNQVTQIADQREPTRKELMSEIVHLRKVNNELTYELGKLFGRLEKKVDNVDVRHSTVLEALQHLRFYSRKSTHFRKDAIKDIKKEFHHLYGDSVKQDKNTMLLLMNFVIDELCEAVGKANARERLNDYCSHNGLDFMKELIDKHADKMNG